jgi:hypothetical protein
MQVRALFALARGRTVMHAVAASFLAVRDLTQPLANDDDDRAYDALVKMASL